MKVYNLNFNLIDLANPIAGVGTAGNIWIVLNALLNIESRSKLYVDMTKHKTINSEDKMIHNSYNAWDYYFDQIQKPFKADKELDSVKIPSKLIYEKRYSNKNRICKKLRNLFWKNFSLKKDLQQDIKSYVDENIKEKYTLGVQIRLTDMAKYHNVKGVDDYVKKVKAIIAKDKRIQQIYLATDDQSIINYFQNQVKIPVIFLDNIYRATNEKPDNEPYDRYQNMRPNHRYLLGREVILDIFILSKCNQLLKADISCVSQLAIIFSEKIEKTYFLTSNIENMIKKVRKYFNKFKKLMVVQ